MNTYVALYASTPVGGLHQFNAETDTDALAEARASEPYYGPLRSLREQSAGSSYARTVPLDTAVVPDGRVLAREDYPELREVLARKAKGLMPDAPRCGWSFTETFMPRHEAGENATCGGCGSTVFVTPIPGRDGQIPPHRTDGSPWNGEPDE